MRSSGVRPGSDLNTSIKKGDRPMADFSDRKAFVVFLILILLLLGDSF